MGILSSMGFIGCVCLTPKRETLAEEVSHNRRHFVVRHRVGPAFCRLRHRILGIIAFLLGILACIS